MEEKLQDTHSLGPVRGTRGTLTLQKPPVPTGVLPAWDRVRDLRRVGYSSPPRDTDRCWLLSSRPLKAGGEREHADQRDQTSQGAACLGGKDAPPVHRAPSWLPEKKHGQKAGRRRAVGQTNDLKPLPPPKKSYSSLQKLIGPSAWAFFPCLQGAALREFPIY